MLLARSAGSIGMHMPLLPVAELANPVNRPGTTMPGVPIRPNSPTKPCGRSAGPTDNTMNRPATPPTTRPAGWESVGSHAGCRARLGVATPAAHFFRQAGTGLSSEGGPEIPSASVSWPEQPPRPRPYARAAKLTPWAVGSSAPGPGAKVRYERESQDPAERQRQGHHEHPQDLRRLRLLPVRVPSVGRACRPGRGAAGGRCASGRTRPWLRSRTGSGPGRTAA